MSKQIRLVYGVCYTNPNFLCNTVKSLLDGNITPADIVIADYGLSLANSLKKKDHVSIIKTPNYGMLSTLYAIIEKYGTKPTVHIILVDEAATYMPHLASEHVNASPDIIRQFQSQIPAGVTFKGAVFGLAGLAFRADKRNELDNELESLLNDTEIPVKVPSSVNNLQPNMIQDTTTADILEFIGSIYLTADKLSGFKNEVFKKPVSFDRFQATVILSNFLEKNNVFRINICHLANNRFIMDRIGCFSRVQKYQLTDYIPAMTELEDMYLCKDKK